MEIPYELKHLRYQQNRYILDQNYYIILEPLSLFYYPTYIKIINYLGELSKEERQLLIPETDYFSFIYSYNKKIILKCIGDMIIGFIYFKENPLFLQRNYYNFNFLTRI